MMPSFARDSVKIIRGKVTEERGTTVIDFADAKTHDIGRCSFQPVSSATTWTDARQAVTVRAVLYLPPSADIRSGDIVEFNGVRYAIDGAPHEWRSPSGRVDNIQCSLIDWQG